MVDTVTETEQDVDAVSEAEKESDTAAAQMVDNAT